MIFRSFLNVVLAVPISLIALHTNHSLAHSPGAHVHGAAALQVTVDGPTVQIELITPLDNLLGFEYAPRTAQQKQAVQSMTAKLNQANTLFILTPAAQCKPAGSVKLSSPALNLGTDKSTASKKEEHAELEAEWTFNCSTPAALKDMEVKLFDAFPNLRQLDVQAVGPRGQAASKLSAKQRRFAW